MADLTCRMAGLEWKNPLIIASCDFGGDAEIVRRSVAFGAAGLITKTIHKIPGVHTWPRPCHYSLRRFGKELNESWTCSQMFSQIPYDQMINEELPQMVKACRQHDVRLIGNVSAIGDDLELWKSAARDVAQTGVDMLELNTGGPHATFGAESGAQNVGAIISLNPALAASVLISNCVVNCARSCPMEIEHDGNLTLRACR